MYADRIKHWGIRIGIGLLAVVLLVAGIALFTRASRQDLLKESAGAIEQTIRKNALQCYVIEGVYPPDLAYLEENYGLQINEEDFIVHYEAFSSNLPPVVQVLMRQHGRRGDP